MPDNIRSYSLSTMGTSCTDITIESRNLIDPPSTGILNRFAHSFPGKVVGHIATKIVGGQLVGASISILAFAAAGGAFALSFFLIGLSLMIISSLVSNANHDSTGEQERNFIVSIHSFSLSIQCGFTLAYFLITLLV